jgi:hypothetical protein
MKIARGSWRRSISVLQARLVCSRRSQAGPRACGPNRDPVANCWKSLQPRGPNAIRHGGRALNAIQQVLGPDRHRAYQALHAVLHCLRDRLPIDEAAQLSEAFARLKINVARPFCSRLERGSDQAAPLARVDGLEPTRRNLTPASGTAGHLLGATEPRAAGPGKGPPRGACAVSRPRPVGGANA